ncbi:MAG: DUF4861 domain-containing protein [Bacteroidales bacterium]|jgi:hypothetical protein|nr:DUF4861 domain-containing protein [Bacteroidales bacterium]
MKNIIIALCVAAALVSCGKRQVTVEVNNPSNVVHDKTTVEIAWADIVAKIPAADPAKLVVTSVTTGEERPSQVIYNGQETPQALIFQVTLGGEESASFLIASGTPQEYVVRTSGRYVPERKDDIAWENDRVAFRMYGPKLAPEYPSNGVDIWMKRTEELVVDEFYREELQNHISYHEDHGKGLDCYKVGHELGAGGICPYINDTLWIGNHYTTQKVLDNGPLRTTFVLTYDNLPVGKQTFSENITISLDGGSQLNKAEVSFDGDFTEIQVALGISLHEERGNTKADAASGYIAYGENAVSEVEHIPSGRNYVGVVATTITETLEKNRHLLALASYKKGDKLTYYFGGGWSKWGFDTDEAWFDYVAQFTARVKNPLKVSVQ